MNDGASHVWTSWRLVGSACLLTLLLLLLFPVVRAFDARVPYALLFFPLAAVSVVARDLVHIPALPFLLFQFPAYASVADVAARKGRLGVAVGAIACVHAGAIVVGGPLFWGPSLVDYQDALQVAAGPAAVECGVVPLGESRSTAVSCARGALDRKAPFWVGFQVMGIDSTVYVGLAHRADGRATHFTWDGDIYGGSALVPQHRLYEVACGKPSVRIQRGKSPITCEYATGGA